jgi:hypothetical protein
LASAFGFGLGLDCGRFGGLDRLGFRRRGRRQGRRGRARLDGKDARREGTGVLGGDADLDVLHRLLGRLVHHHRQHDRRQHRQGSRTDQSAAGALLQLKLWIVFAHRSIACSTPATVRKEPKAAILSSSPARSLAAR